MFGESRAQSVHSILPRKISISPNGMVDWDEDRRAKPSIGFG
jgi:hypothetical protein